MRIESTAVSSLARSAGDAGSAGKADSAQAGRTPAGDAVQLSPRARMLAIARKALEETPAVRRSVVDEARARLKAGQIAT